MTRPPSRRDVLAGSAAAAAALAARPLGSQAAAGPLYALSLAEWSLHRTIRAGELDPLDFARKARALGFDAIEHVSQLFAERAADFAWLGELKRRAEGEGVRSLLIMVDGEGELAAPDAAARERAVHAHFKWAAAAGFLGCRAIRVNAAGALDPGEGAKHAADALVRLADVAEPYGVSVLVENHGGLSSNGAWLASVMRIAASPRVGTLPDFGNFGEYDRYQGVAELMPFAQAVSAKSHAFDAQGAETRTDYRRMMKIVVGAGYHGAVGVEYEGDALPEDEGIRRTKALLELVRAELA